MSKSKRKSDADQVKKQLAILKRKGLYKPKDAKAKPTRYAMRQLRKLSDVVSGKATVLKAGREALARAKADQYVTARDRVVVRNQRGVKYKIDKRGNVVAQMAIGDSAKVTSRKARIVNGVPEKLQPGQYYELPVRHGTSLHYQRMDSLEDIMALIGEYSEGKNGRAGFDALKYLNIATLERGGKYRIRFIDPETEKRRERTVRAYNEDEARGIFRANNPEFSTAIIISIKPV